jgi:hypothetical protein
MAGTDESKKLNVKNQMVKLLTDNITRNASELDILNKETNKSILADENYQAQKESLTKTIQDNMVSLKDLTKSIEDNRETMVNNTEQKIMDIINKGVELRKKALDDELNDYKEYVDGIIKERERENQTEDYNKSMKKQLDERQKIQNKLNKISLDTSIEGFQRRKELEEQLRDLDEKISDDRTNRERDLTKQNLEDNVKEKEAANKAENERLDELFSEQNKKVAAHKILVEQSFNSIKPEFPELFTELNLKTDTFFSTFEGYELKFGNIIGDVAKKFKDEILPEIKGAIEMINEIERKARGIDYSGVKFDPKKDYQSEINKLLSSGVSKDDDSIKKLQEQMYAKIYSDPKLTSLYEGKIPVDMRQTKNSLYGDDVNYAGVKFDAKKDYQSEINKLLTSGIEYTDQRIQELQKAMFAKIYSSQNLTSLYENKIPVNMRQSAATTATNRATGIVNTSIAQQNKVSAFKPEEIQIAKDKLAIKDLQLKWYATTNATTKSTLAKQAEAIRDKYGWQPQDLRSYTAPIGMFSQGINKGLVKKTGTYLLHGTASNPEWVLTNAQMFNLVKGMANNLSVNMPASNSRTESSDINLSINIMGNADRGTVSEIRDAGKQILSDLKKELNKKGQYV